MSEHDIRFFVKTVFVCIMLMSTFMCGVMFGADIKLNMIRFETAWMCKYQLAELGKCSYPFNYTKIYQIKKLANIKKWDGQCLIRLCDYLIRYDIIKKDVFLHSIKDIKDIYRLFYLIPQFGLLKFKKIYFIGI